MEKTLEAGPWLVGDRFSMADIALTPYVNRLAMLGMDGMWRGRMPNLEKWFERIKARPSFKPALIDWIPDSLKSDLITNGRKSWPEVQRILNVA